MRRSLLANRASNQWEVAICSRYSRSVRLWGCRMLGILGMQGWRLFLKRVTARERPIDNRPAGWQPAPQKPLRSMALGPDSGTKKSCQTRLHSSVIRNPYSHRPRSPGPELLVPKVNFAPAAFAMRMNDGLGNLRSEEHTSELQSPCNL